MDGNLNIKIKILGVGGAGCNMASHLYSEYIEQYSKKENIEVIAINSDIQVLNKTKSDRQIIIGEKLTNGWGCGMRPEIGKESALESYQELLETLEGTDMVFIASGMGGGTGTGAASVIAQAAKEVGALTLSIVTKPFRFEGPKRTRFAIEGIESLAKETDSLIVINNEKLMKVQEKKLSLKEAFRMVDDVLAKAVQGIISIVLESSENDDINVDFADLKTILSYPGSSIMSVAVAQGEKAAIEVVHKALDNPLLEVSDIKGTRGVLIHFTMNEGALLEDIYEALDIVYENTSEDADIIFGTTTDYNMPIDEVKVTLIATGFTKEKNKNIRKIDTIIKQKEAKVMAEAFEAIPTKNDKEVLRLKF